MRSILGTKIGMTSLFETSGKLIPVSVIHCEPNVVLELKTIEKHNSSGAKVGYLSKQEKSFNKAELGIFKKINVTPRQHIRTLKNLNGYNVGDEINVNIFEKGEYVDIQGTTKGHGFTGAIFR
jgi:large subunit ribosomal protein L3